jgi:DeoR/GlpR family transcriptional regulator of sugar metabolism
MKAAGRQLKIRQMLETQEFVDFQSLCRELDASESSIRRDLIAMESGAVIKRVYGGAMAVQASNSHLLDFDFQSARMGDEKRRIAQVAAGLIEDGQTTRCRSPTFSPMRVKSSSP